MTVGVTLEHVDMGWDGIASTAWHMACHGRAWGHVFVLRFPIVFPNVLAWNVRFANVFVQIYDDF